ncbi:MAG: arginine--tRNA ligase [Candidatus Margulisbacteria bacterium]|nr:arginine--tRNA ligase [Candidatus Margulisiibacteriota bacterium]
MLQAKIESLLAAALSRVGLGEPIEYRVEVPPRKELGDFASNIAILGARQVKQNPLTLAARLVEKVKEIDQGETIAKIDVVKPGFINFSINDKIIQRSIPEIVKQDHDWGKGNSGIGSRVLLEFVSANPTGPLHVGHGRWAVIGDVIARLLKAAGYQVATEFYINNVGTQVETLEASVRARRAGRDIPEGGYGGEYIKEVKGETREEMLRSLLGEQQRILAELGVAFDRWFQESELHAAGKVMGAVQKLRDLGVTFEENGATWFKSQALGDDKNRVLVREDGRPTYFAADIAYHLDKFSRGFDRLINIWGTDHHGYVGRLKAALKILGLPVESFEIIIGQLVTLYRGDEPIRMSKRTGEMITLQEVMAETGVDATRFFFAATDVNSHLDFDLELAKKKSADNPVYYLQYGHARICSILRKSEILNPKSENDLLGLTDPAERELMLKLLAWPRLVEEAAKLRQPHRVTEYGKELAITFHHFYEKCRVLGHPGRLVLVDSSRIVLRNVLELLGITAPEKM